MKEGWEIKKLADYFDITSSKRVFQSEWKSEGVPFYRAREIVKLAKNGYVNNDLFISTEMYSSYKEKYGVPSIGDILITGVGTLGICYVIPDNSPLYFKDGNVIWLHKREEINSKYILYAFQTDYVKKQVHKNQGVTVGTYTIEGAKNTLIPLPNSAEQQRIVGILDAEFEKIDALKANAEKNLQNAKDLFQAALNQYFTDRKYKSSILGKECDFVRGPFGGSLKKNCFVDAGYPVYEQQHAIYNRFVFRYYVNEKKYLEMKRFTVNGGDLIMSCSGTIGKVAIVPMDAPKGIINQALLKLTPKTNLIPEYLLWYMNSISFTKQIQEHSQGAAIKNVASVAILKQISLPLPSVNEQREIIQHLNELSDKCKLLQDNHTQTIALCNDLKQALLRKAFNGDL